MKNLFSLPLSDHINNDIFLQALTDDSYSCLESISDDIFQLPEPSTVSALFELPEPDYLEPEFSKERTSQKPCFKKIGTLHNDERAKKISKYLEKKKKRNWHKKINYSCRKQVADQRVRVKGRFVSKQQALSLGGTASN